LQGRQHEKEAEKRERKYDLLFGRLQFHCNSSSSELSTILLFLFSLAFTAAKKKKRAQEAENINESEL
jgi:hypothetical protein